VSQKITFNEAQFQRLFPFFISLSKELTILSVGSSLMKISRATVGDNFLSHFQIKRPYISRADHNSLNVILGQLTIIGPKHQKDIFLRGQIEFIADTNSYLFLGTPWFSTLDQLLKYDLSLSDYANHDPAFDLLHVLKNQEIRTDEIRELLDLVKIQKDKLVESERNYRTIIENATDIIYKCDLIGQFTYVNDVAERYTEYTRSEMMAMTYLDLIRQDYRDKATDFYTSQVAQNTRTSYFEFPLITKTGREIWIGQNVQFLINQTDEPEFTALAFDINERKLAESKLRLQEEKYRNIIANMHLGLLEVDENEVVQYANQSFCDMSGYSIEELQGKNPINLLIQPEHEQTVLRTIQKRQSGVSDMYPMEVNNKDGETKWWIVSGAPLYDEKGNYRGSVGIHLDITQRKKLEEEINLARQKAESSSRAKELFLATMSHEIRTPLNAVVGISHLMQIDKNSRTREHIDLVALSAKNLLALITDILDFSKIESGKIKFNNETFSLTELVQGVYKSFEMISENKGISLKLEIGKKTPRYVLGDEIRLTQILNNLLSNAVKFTQFGEVVISVNSVLTESGAYRIYFKVADTGIGIDQKNIERIFLEFEQAEESRSSHLGGTGLGLNITKKLVDLQNGKIKVESKLGSGSTFSFYIDYLVPKTDVLESKTYSEDSEMELNVLFGKRILVVEDNLVNQKIVGSYLNLWGIEVTFAENGSVALAKMQYELFDLVLMDIFMPVMDGFQAIEQIRLNPKLKDTIIIALTASAEVNLVEKALQIGANECLYKPINSKLLQQKLNYYLTEDQNTESITAKNFASNTNLTNQYIDLTYLEGASLGSSTFILEMLEVLQNEIPEILVEAKSHLEANRFSTFSRDIHKLKNGLLTLGVSTLKGDLFFLEKTTRENDSTPEVTEIFKKIEGLWTDIQKELTSVILAYQDSPTQKNAHS